ncbi:5-hydroxytryptamine receptor 2A-like, partial [Musca vetustissima]|uniref:5-hydroxytryptamine receptor 2A-like n=1 Tax=Musca vetustissima TaxID=27455 RepID=UPI002AB5E9EE
PDLMAQKKRKRLRLRFGKFTNVKTNMAMGRVTTLGLVEGNSTNTVNTVEVEDTEFSSSNVDSKSRAGIEVANAAGSHINATATHSHCHGHAVVATTTTTAAPPTTTTLSSTSSSAPVAATANTITNLNNTEEIPSTSSTTQIATVSHLVALANQQRNASAKQTSSSSSVSASAPSKCLTQPVTVVENPLEPVKTTASTPADAVNVTTVSANGMSSTVVHNNSHHHQQQQVDDTEVLADPQLQQQLEQVQQQTQNEVPASMAAAIPPTGTVAVATTTTTTATIATTANKTVVGAGGGGGAGTSASNATTITSISALSPQTPNAATPSAPTAHTSHTTPASVSTSSQQATPLPRPKNPQQLSSIANPMHKVTKRKETLEAKRERKAAKTLAIITGAFVVCWLPFFVMALLLPLCEACEINDGVASLFLWLGYFNSTLNPVIYTIFSPEFRQAFKRILFGGHRPVHYRSGKL